MTDLELKLLNRDLKELYENAELKDALICHYFPQYDLDSVSELTEGTAMQLLRAIRQIENSRNINNLMIAAASKSKAAYSKLMSHYKTQLGSKS